jgi:hypothetical protein
MNRILRPEIAIRINTKDLFWELVNIRRGDEAGDPELENGTDGACLELVVHARKKLLPLSEGKLDIAIHRAAESSYFYPHQTSHYVLLIHPVRLGGETYLFDPAFKRLGILSQMDDYKIYGKMNDPERALASYPDIGGSPGQALPIAKFMDYITFITVEPVEGLLDQTNFTVSLYAQRKHALRMFPFLKLGKKNGEIFFWKDDAKIAQALSPEDYVKLSGRVNQLAKNIEFIDVARAKNPIPPPKPAQ